MVPIRGSRPQNGFTLLEAMVAMTILAMVILTLLGVRTEALVDATEARNWRLAKEIANEKMSELKAGAREMPPEPGRNPVDHGDDELYKDFFYEILIGEQRIMDWESDRARMLDYESSGERTDRLEWQREREAWRRARQKGMSIDDYRTSLEKERLEEEDDRVPSETDLEDVMVVVYFPNVRARKGESVYAIREKVSTLAIQGLTPEQAETLAKSRGKGNTKIRGTLTASPTSSSSSPKSASTTGESR